MLMILSRFLISMGMVMMASMSITEGLYVVPFFNHVEVDLIM